MVQHTFVQINHVRGYYCTRTTGPMKHSHGQSTGFHICAVHHRLTRFGILASTVLNFTATISNWRWQILILTSNTILALGLFVRCVPAFGTSFTGFPGLIIVWLILSMFTHSTHWFFAHMFIAGRACFASPDLRWFQFLKPTNCTFTAFGCIVRWCCETMEQWNNGTMEQWNNGTMEQHKC